jgi:hypothetical protein
VSKEAVTVLREHARLEQIIVAQDHVHTQIREMWKSQRTVLPPTVQVTLRATPLVHDVVPSANSTSSQFREEINSRAEVLSILLRDKHRTG